MDASWCNGGSTDKNLEPHLRPLPLLPRFGQKRTTTGTKTQLISFGKQRPQTNGKPAHSKMQVLGSPLQPGCLRKNDDGPNTIKYGTSKRDGYLIFYFSLFFFDTRFCLNNCVSI